jgi:hypothetical protein
MLLIFQYNPAEAMLNYDDLSLILERDNFWWKNLFWKDPSQLAFLQSSCFNKMDEIEVALPQSARFLKPTLFIQ